MTRFDSVRWAKVAAAAGVSFAQAGEMFTRLSALYAEPHRHYHNTRHILECLAEFDRVKGAARDPIALELAIWFHDAIYDPRGADNEQKSAELAKEFFPSPVIEKLILATRHSFIPKARDACLMVDIDLSILGRPAARFWEYEEQIRAEYAFVASDIFCARRAEILTAFLNQKYIFRTEEFRTRCEKRARQNLIKSIERLTRRKGGPSSLQGVQHSPRPSGRRC